MEAAVRMRTGKRSHCLNRANALLGGNQLEIHLHVNTDGEDRVAVQLPFLSYMIRKNPGMLKVIFSLRSQKRKVSNTEFNHL